MNITLIGFMGTGKTATGKSLAKRLGWRFVDIDALIEHDARKSIAKIFAEHGEEVFRRMEQRLIRRIAREDEQVIATGGGAFLDPENQCLLKAAGPVVCLSASAQTILKRVRHRLRVRPLLATSTFPLARIRQLLAERAPVYARADLTVNTNGLTPTEAADLVLEALGPSLCKSWQYLLTHSDELMHRYGGKYIAVIDDNVVGVGATQLKAYREIRRTIPQRREVGIYYIPMPDESLVG